MSDVVSVLAKLGGFATWGELRRAASGRAVRSAVASGAIRRTARGRYSLPTGEEGRVAASRLAGVSSHLSAAAHWGWPTKHPAERPHVVVGRQRKIAPHRRDEVVLRYRDLRRPDEVVDGWVTSPVRTVVDCCLDLPFDEALAVFDSSWRAGLKPREVQLAARRLPARQRNRVLAVARAADLRAANPFESALRAIALRVPGLHVEPQVVVKDGEFWARVDLADETLKICIEADSYEHHAPRKAFVKDCRRYNGLAVRGWLVLRFTWEEVMFEPERVRSTLLAAVAARRPARPTGTKARKQAKSA